MSDCLWCISIQYPRNPKNGLKLTNSLTMCRFIVIFTTLVQYSVHNGKGNTADRDISRSQKEGETIQWKIIWGGKRWDWDCKFYRENFCWITHKSPQLLRMQTRGSPSCFLTGLDDWSSRWADKLTSEKLKDSMKTQHVSLIDISDQRFLLDAIAKKWKDL